MLQGGAIQASIDEQIVFGQPDHNESAIWSRLPASYGFAFEGKKVLIG